mgnify:CR=1 FL=1
MTKLCVCHCKYFSHYFTLSRSSTNFDGEVAAIQRALEQISHRRDIKENKIVVLTDSVTAIQAIEQYDSVYESFKIKEVRSGYKLLQTKFQQIILQ